MLNLNSVLIGSEDPGALVSFYTRILGEPGWNEGGFVGWQAGGGYLVVGPHSEVKGRNDAPGRILINFETTDVEGEFERIRGEGASVVAEPYHPDADQSMLLATFEDPDGNYFQVASPMSMQ